MIYLDPIPFDKDKFPFDENSSSTSWDRDNTDVVLPHNKSWITDFVYRMRGGEAPTLLNVWTALSTLSAALRRNTWLTQAGEPLFTNMYVLLVGPAGIVKKTTTMEIAQRVLSLYNLKWKNSIYFPIKRVTVLSDDFTTEVMIEALHRPLGPKSLLDKDREPVKDKHGNDLRYYPDSSCIIFGDEISSTLRAKYQHGNLEFLKAIYSNKSIHEHMTKTSGKHTMRDLHTNFIGTTTLDGFSQIPSSLYTDGFLSRMVVVYAFDTDRMYPEPFIPQGAPTYDDLADGLSIVTTHHQGALTPTPEAIDWYYSWYYEYHNKLRDNPDDAGALSRIQLLVRKVAALLCAAEYNDSNEVTLRHFTDAYKLISYTYGQNPLLGTNSNDNELNGESISYLDVYERVGRLLRRHNNKDYTVADIQRACRIRGKYPTVEQIKRVLHQLLTNSKILARSRNGNHLTTSGNAAISGTTKFQWGEGQSEKVKQS